MDSKLELTKSQLETILRLINDVNFNKEAKSSKNESAIKLQKNSTVGKRTSSLSKRRSYSAVNLSLKNLSNDDLINESIHNLITNKRNEKIPQVQKTKTRPMPINDQPNKLRRNKSLIELKREKWDRERNEMKDADSWYEKFDSFKRPIDRSRSQPNIMNSYDELFNTRFDSESQVFSPVSNFNDNESTVLSHTYTAPHSPSLTNLLNLNQMNDNLLNEITNQTPNPFNVGNQPRRSFRRYAHQFNNVNILEKRRKQQEYQAQLEAQLAHKRQQNKLRKQQELNEDRRLEEKLLGEQAELRKEFEMDHKETGRKETMKDEFDLKRNDLTKRKERKLTNLNTLTNLDKLERLESTSKELIKVFKEASTQTDTGSNDLKSLETRLDSRLETRLEARLDSRPVSTQTNDQQLNKWSINFNSSNDLQPVIVKSNRSAILRTANRPKPKWTKQLSKDDDNRTSILPKLTSQKGNQLTVRKKWNS